MDLKPHPYLVGISDALKDTVHYQEIRMANLQRGYAWDRKNLGTYFDDSVAEISRVYPENTAFKGPFLGVLIVTEINQPSEDGKAPPPKKCELVDGQQRITSTFILLSILLDHIIACKKSLLELLKAGALDKDTDYLATDLTRTLTTKEVDIRRFLFAKEPKGNDIGVPRLLTWDYLEPLASKTVFKEGSHTASSGVEDSDLKDARTKRFADAIIYLREKVVDFKTNVAERSGANPSSVDIEVNVAEQLIQLSEVIMDRLYVLKLVTANPQDAAEVFLSLNSKGKPLTTHDIVKANLMDLLVKTNHDAASFNNQWEAITNSSTNLNALLRLAWVLYEKKVSERTLASEFLSHIKLKPEENAKKFLKFLVETAECHSMLVFPEPEPLVALKSITVSRLKALADISSSYRILLTRVLLTSRKFDEQTQKEFLNNEFHEYVRSTYILAFTGRSEFELPQKMEDFYIGLAGKISDKKSMSDVLATLQETVLKTLDVFSAKNLSKESQLLVLHALEDACRAKSGQFSIGWKDHGDSIEHTAPQKPTDEWLKDLKVLKENYAEVAFNAGNLALLNREQNSRIQRKPWTNPKAPEDPKKSKRAAYEHADFYTTQDLIFVETWSPELVKSRNQWIAEQIVSIHKGTKAAYSNFKHFSEWQSSK